MQKFLFGNLILRWIKFLPPTTHNGKDGKEFKLAFFFFFILLEKNWPTVSSLDIIHSANAQNINMDTFFWQNEFDIFLFYYAF